MSGEWDRYPDQAKRLDAMAQKVGDSFSLPIFGVRALNAAHVPDLLRERDLLKQQRDEAEAECNRYREALGRIYQRAKGEVLEIARQALNDLPSVEDE